MRRDEFLPLAASFLSEKTGIPADAFRPGSNLVKEGLVDSLAFMQLIDFVESATGARLDTENFSLERFSTLEKIHANFIAAAIAGDRL